MNLLVRVSFFLAIVNLFLSEPAVAQAQNKNNHLLWRISKPGLTQPSYLYGTIHIMDKRVFNFGDSLYAAIEKSEGYAMELDPDAAMIKAIGEDDKSDSLLVKDAVDKKLFDKSKKKLEQKLKKPAHKITVKEVKAYFNDLYGVLDPNKGMQTVMDTYLYNAARKAGKWVGGIEDVEDQWGIEDDTKIEYYLIEIQKDSKETKSLIERMIRIYETEDLEGIESLDAETSLYMIDSVMIRRNKKMARRIDSLMRIRNTFFAVGTAHLPGDSGVISLLRRKGFTVDPVISSKRIHATEYKFPEKELNWATTEAETGLFTVQFPGPPQKSEVEGMREMKMYADLGTNLFYLTLTFAGSELKSEDSFYLGMIKNMQVKGNLISKKDFQQQGIKGKEVYFKAGNIFYRFRFFYFESTTFVALVGTEVEKALNSTDSDKFLASFKINKEKKYVVDEAWTKQEDELTAFSIEFPGKPNIKKREVDKKDGFSTDHYVLYDEKKTAYYQLMVKSALRGNYLTADTATFNNYIQKLIEDFKVKIIRKGFIKVNGFPALDISFTNESEGITVFTKVLYLHRGSRMYLVAITTPDSTSMKGTIDQFFSSFKLLPLKEQNWTSRSGPDKTFSTWSPDAIAVLKDDNEMTQRLEGDFYFDTYDSISSTSLFIKKSVYPKYFWAKNDTSLLRREANTTITYQDSMLEYKLVKNGNYPAAEMLVRMADNHSIKKFRFVLVGDTMFLLYSVISPENIQKKNYHRFFEDFKPVNEKANSTLFRKKAAELISALKNADSASLEKLKPVLKMVIFEKEDLPLLHDALLHPYPDSAEYTSVADYLIEIIEDFKSKTTAEFVKKNYAGLPANMERIRYDLLYLLAQQKDLESFQLIRDLLKLKTPISDNAYKLINEFRDTLKLTVQIYPDLLHLFKDQNAWGPLVRLTNELLDSNLIQKSILDKYRLDIYAIAEKGVKESKIKDNDNYYEYYIILELLGKLNTKESEQYLRKFLASENIYYKYSAATTLLENKLPVGAADLTKIAANNEFRIAFYERLKELKKESLFPLVYKNQKAFAESELYTMATEGDEVEVSKITYVGERTATFRGKKQKFYLFKVSFEGEGGVESRLGIVGPYSSKTQSLITESDVCGIYYDQEYNAGKLDSHLKTHLLLIESEE